VTSVAGRTGAVTLSKSDVGLSNVDNTADANKSVNYSNSAWNADVLDGYHYYNLPYAGTNANFDWQEVWAGPSGTTINVYGNFGSGIYFARSTSPVTLAIPPYISPWWPSFQVAEAGTGTAYLYKLRKLA